MSGTTYQITGSPHGYDANGNMTNDGANTLVYDAENRVLSATNGGSSGSYTYDGNSLRVKKVSGGNTTVYIFSGSKVIAEYDNGAAVGSPSCEYIYSGGALLAKIDSSGTKYYHQDHLSNRLITDSNGNTFGQQGHFPFGEQWYPVPPASPATKWEFTAYERDPESGNDYAMMRSYVNRLARFSSPDPLSGSSDNPQSLNHYPYTLGDPIDLSDPLGLIWACTTAAGVEECTYYPDDQNPSTYDPSSSNNSMFGFGDPWNPTPPNLVYQGGRRGGGKVLNDLRNSKLVKYICDHSSDAATVGVGFDMGIGVAESGQLNLTGNGVSGELTLSVSGGLSAGVVGPDAYVSVTSTKTAPDNSFLDSQGQASVTYTAGVQRFSYSTDFNGTNTGTIGPSLSPVTVSTSLMVSKPLVTVSYAGYLLDWVRPACKAVTGK